jgi:hypothetical protein
MRRLPRAVTGLAAAGALTAAALVPVPVGAAVAGIDMSGHSYLFDRTYADSSGGPDAVVHGTVPFARGRQDPPDTPDGAVRFDGRAADFLTIDAPVLSYGTADFTLDLWLSTTADRPETVLDTTGCHPGTTGLVLTLTGDGSVDLGTGHPRGEAPDDQTTHSAAGGGDGTAAYLHALQRQATAAAAREDHREDGRPGRVNDGRWHDVTVIRTGTTIVLSIDGRPIRTRTATRVDDLRSDAGVRIGRSSCSDAHAFEGELDDLTADPTPPAALAETPIAALLPASAVMIGAAVTVVRRRRRAAGAHR